MLSGGLVFASFAEGDPHAGAVREALQASRALELSTTTLRAWRSYSQFVAGAVLAMFAGMVFFTNYSHEIQASAVRRDCSWCPRGAFWALRGRRPLN